ncbi:helix-turn-helix domain-containing protein [Halalkalibacterium halodurans]|uniref:helix-turn-helix domain-containing protein n=1 Tax=Halalkalibacterium halodurans TaxID=86665 RepID=UPI002AA9655E|nr:helix-turn-helix domain-containing protein [Halalkalibacterium halodurans]MDY7223988.1 helix-turn-helix domain-containing protein [Halalkalibacterium halodurans]MDY7243209.1 helix-turn-helix domain-containing protein [Halalkalibacterium halodurans]
MSNNTKKEPAVQRATMTIDEVATYLGVSQSTVRRWMEHQGLPALKLQLGGRLLFKRELIDRWLEKKMSGVYIEEKPYGQLRILKP